jgi:mannose-6-phosphate isomerase-like protein (cupin superfamily)
MEHGDKAPPYSGARRDAHVRHDGDFRWESVPVLAYKEAGGPFKDITRQVLFEGDSDLPCQWRYFEIAPGGHSTLERHEHLHAVMVIRGAGRALVGDRVVDLDLFDVVRIGPLTWHQFRATDSEPLGFLCVVNVERDRPQLPGPGDLEALRRIPGVGEFIRV